MSRLRSVARFRIQPGKAGEFKRIAAECLAIVRAKDPGTSQYEWYLNDEQTECIVLETYDTADALRAHAKNVGHLIGQLLGISQCSVEMLGTPTPEIREVLRRMSMTLLTPLQGVD